MKLSEDLHWRGLIKDKTFQDIAWLDTPKTFYHGVDVGSADSLTIGNLAALLLARRLLDGGWKTVLLVGGATSLIGDPGGKDAERALISREQVEVNKAGIAKQVKQLFAGKEFDLVDNYDWFKDLGYLEFLRDVGKHYSVTELVQRDFIADRMGANGTGISYAEFSYSLIQGYDFWHLFKNYGVQLQIGGSDQWGNMLSGVPLIRKKEAADAHALSMPLVINKASGKKFGKSEDGAIWLDDTKTSVYRFYQFWLNVDDEDVEYYLKVYTLLTPDEIGKIMTEFKADRAQRGAQKALADQVTLLVHGHERLNSIKRVTEALFGNSGYQSLQSEDFNQLAKELPTVDAKIGDPLVELLVKGFLAGSNTEARHFLEDNAIYINGQQQPLNKTTIGQEDVLNQHVVLRRGKNTQMLVKIQ